MAEVVIVEQLFEQPLSDEEHSRLGKRLDSCVELRNGRWMRSYLSSDHLRMICEFEAPDAQSIRDAYGAAGITVQTVWTSELYKRE